MKGFSIAQMRSSVQFLYNAKTSSATTDREAVVTGGRNDAYVTLLTTRGRLRRKSASRGLDFGLIESREGYELICRFQTSLESNLGIDVKLIIGNKVFTISSWEKIDEINNFYKFSLNASSEQLVISPDGLGTELVTNGGFSGSASGWTLFGNVAYNSNHVVFSSSMSVSSVSQTGLNLVLGRTYRVSFDMNGSAGGVNFGIGSAAPFFPAANGTMTFDQVYDGTNPGLISIYSFNQPFVGSITNISVKQII